MADVLDAPISVTPRAAQRIALILEAEAPGTALRVAVTGGGCSGFQYQFVFDAEPQPDDWVFMGEGATVLVDPVSAEYLQGSELDYVDELIGASLQIRNPNAKSSCGCGTSFSL